MVRPEKVSRSRHDVNNDQRAVDHNGTYGALQNQTGYRDLKTGIEFCGIEFAARCVFTRSVADEERVIRMRVEGDDALSMELIAGGTMYIQASDGARKPIHNTTPGPVCSKRPGAYRLSTVPGPSVNDPTDCPRSHRLSTRPSTVHDPTVCQHNA